MERTAVLALLLAAVLALLCGAAQHVLRDILHRRPGWIWAAPVLCTAIFAAAAALADASSLPLTALVLHMDPTTVRLADLNRRSGRKHHEGCRRFCRRGANFHRG